MALQLPQPLTAQGLVVTFQPRDVVCDKEVHRQGQLGTAANGICPPLLARDHGGDTCRGAVRVSLGTPCSTVATLGPGPHTPAEASSAPWWLQKSRRRRPSVGRRAQPPLLASTFLLHYSLQCRTAPAQTSLGAWPPQLDDLLWLRVPPSSAPGSLSCHHLPQGEPPGTLSVPPQRYCPLCAPSSLTVSSGTLLPSPCSQRSRRGAFPPQPGGPSRQGQ